jgi:hypothetical protein
VDPVTAALVGWLVGRAADATTRKLGRLVQGDKQENALRAVVAEAITAAVHEVVVPGDRTVVMDALRREGPGTPTIDIRNVLALREAALRVVAPRLSVLADQGYSADAGRLADDITRRIVDGIQLDAARGGSLAPVADFLRHEELAGPGKRTAAAVEEMLKEMQAARGVRFSGPAPRAGRHRGAAGDGQPRARSPCPRSEREPEAARQDGKTQPTPGNQPPAYSE